MKNIFRSIGLTASLCVLVSCGNSSGGETSADSSKDSAGKTITGPLDGPQPGLKYQSIQLDETHNLQSKTPGTKSIAYEIGECDGLIIDPKGYIFLIPENLKPGKIDLVQVVIGDHTFEADWADSGMVTVDKYHLRMVVGHLPFTGFKGVDEITLEMGTRIKTEGSRREEFGLVYRARVNILKEK